MDLRAFGVGPRTWVHQLTYRRADKALIAAGALAFAASTVLAFMEVGDLWVPEALLRLAAG
jgi:energy-coupling factor transport system permease protein